MERGFRKKRRVLFITITFHPEPGAMRGLPLAKSLYNLYEWDVEVLTALPWYPIGKFYGGYRLKPYQIELIDGIPVHRVWLYPSHDRSAMRRTATYVSFMVSALLFAVWRIKRSDIIYHVDNLPTTAFIGAILRLFWGAKVVQHIGDLWPDTVTSSGMLSKVAWAGLLETILHTCMFLVYASNDLITVISNGFRRTLIQRGVKSEKLVVIPNWADENRLSPVPGNFNNRRLFNVNEDEFMILYAGNIGPLQELKVIAHAAEQLRDLPVKFIVVGDGPDKKELERAIAERNLGDRVLLFAARPVEEMPALNAIADALLIHLKDEPFLHDTVPSKTQVCLLAGRPILMGCKGEAAHHVEAAGAGVCFEPQRGEQLAKAVRDLIALGKEARVNMGSRGREYYYRNFSLAKGSSEMNRLFRGLADGAKV